MLDLCFSKAKWNEMKNFNIDDPQMVQEIEENISAISSYTA